MRIPFALGRIADCAPSLRSRDRDRPRGCTGPIPGVDDRLTKPRVAAVETRACLASIPDAKNVGPVIEQVTNGGGGMPSFKNTLSEQQIKKVASYVTTKIAK
jgi:mono/diheme cytochrome c family protein